MADLPTKACTKCSVEKPLTEYNGRQRTCRACVEAAKAKTLERKEAVAYTDALAERIVDALAAGMTIAEVCEQSAMPAPRQLRAWRRSNPDFHSACEQAEQASAAAHLDRAKQVLKDLEDKKLPGADAKTLFDGHMKLASTLNPHRYGAHATVDVTSQGKPLVDFGAAIQALIDALPSQPALPPPIEVEATEVPEGATLQ
jgi:hydroxylamine reductase (hybrid-cluster protein)